MRRPDGRRRRKRSFPRRRKYCKFTADGVEYIDYKDVNLLKRFVSDRAKVRARRVTGNDTQQQAEVARAIKNAREMALLPYTTRVTTQRNNRGDRGDRGDRGPRPDRRDDAAENSDAAEAPAAEAVEAAETTEEV